MSETRKFYWDSSCFICFFNEDEKERRQICEDVLQNAKLKKVEIWTSTITITEVIRPKDKFFPKPLPVWTHLVLQKVPTVELELQKLWDFFIRRTLPTRLLSKDEIALIQEMFEYKFLQKIRVDEIVAKKAVELSRDFGLRPMDATHAASAILKKVDVLQRWDKDYSKIAHLITVDDPQILTSQPALIDDYKKPIGPEPQSFAAASKEISDENPQVVSASKDGKV